MNRPPPPMPERLEELLADRALVGLDDAERAELAALLAQNPGIDEASLDLAAAAADVAFSGAEHCEPLPAALRSRLMAVAQDQGAGTQQVAPPPQPSPARGEGEMRSPPEPSPAKKGEGEKRTLRLLIWGGWLAAAAGWAVAVTLLLPGHSDDPARHRAKLLAEAKDVKTIPWADPAKGPLTGDVVWSDSRQEGYIRFRGLPANDPKREQYQLWIIDAGRKAGTPPVDGGVFDVRPGAGGEVVIPIRAAIKVHKADWFAVTIEQPGGVVVSDQGRIAAVAKPG